MDKLRISELFARLKPRIIDLISSVGGGVGPFAPSPHDLNSAHHTGSIADSQATQFLKTDGSRQLIGNQAVADGVTIDGVDLSAHAGNASAHHALVTVLDSPSIDFSLTGQQVSGSVIASSDVSATAVEKVLKSTAAGGLKLKQLEITNDLTVGTNVLNVDVATGNIGINCVPDSQFDLDVAGNLRAQGWIVGRHALQVKGAVMICHFDGAEPYNTDFTGNPTGHMGQVAAITGGVIYRPGKFGKALQIAEDGTNLITLPSFETATVWTRNGVSNTVVQSADEAFVGNYSMKITIPTGSIGGAFHSVNLTIGLPYTFSVWVKAEAGFTFKLLFFYGVTKQEFAFDTTGEWQRVSSTYTPDATGSHYLHIYSDSAASEKIIYVDAALCEQKAYATPYYDGSMPGCSWSGTANASTSTRTKAALSYTNFSKLPKGSINMMVNSDDWNGGGGYEAETTNILVYGSPGTNGIFVRNIFSRYITVTFSGVTTLNSGFTVDNNKWYMLSITWGDGVLNFYIDGVLKSTASGNIIVPTIPTLIVGGRGGNYDVINGYVDDFAVFSRVLSADEIKAIYESDAPIFSETSTWSWRTPTNLAWADANGLWANDADAQNVFGVCGVDGYTFGAMALDAGDIILGRNVSGKSAIKWDISAGTFGFYGNGSSTVQVQIGTDGSLLAGAGRMKLNSEGMSIYGTGAAGSTRTFRWFDTSDGNRLTGYLYSDYGGSGGVATAMLLSVKNTGDPWSYPLTSVIAMDSSASLDVRLVVGATDGGIIYCTHAISTEAEVRIKSLSTTPTTRSGYGILYVNSTGQLMYKKPAGTTHTVVA